MGSIRKAPSYHVHKNGFLMAAGFDPANFDSALTYAPDDDDVFICTYPKCGTTWMQCIVHLLKSGGRPLGADQRMNRVAPHIEDHGRDFVQQLPRPRLIKTHLTYDLVPKNGNAKYIYVARNPKDCCVSFYHHTRGFPAFYDFADGSFDDYFELFLAGKVDFCDYFDHLLSYFEQRDDPNVLFVLYEEMKADTAASIKNIGRFLGGVFQDSSEDPAILEKVLKHSSFQSMKSTPRIWSTERPKDSTDFIRKGKVGDWRSHFSEDQSNRLDKKFKEKLGGSGAEYLWKAFDC